jgi:glucosamine--fructose-6-phosphate aminotransferase (isomerizing)
LLHNHDLENGRFKYRYPLVQYKIIDGTPVIIAITDDAIDALRSIICCVSQIETPRKVIKLNRSELNITEEFFGISEETRFYQFIRPWLGLNSSNYRKFKESSEKEAYELLTRCLIGNLLSISKYLNYRVNDEICLTHDFKGVKLCACGTSYHAAMSSAYLWERLAKLPVSLEIASEFRYKEPLLSKDELFIDISQSGETADTLEALKMAKKANMKTVAICNVDNSSIVRTAHTSILTRAGIEKGVASTKAFATQIMILWLMVLKASNDKKTISQDKLKDEIKTIKLAHQAMQITPKLHEKIKRLSKRYLHGHGFFFIGRDIFYPLALEGALKLKEISYLHAEGYPAGEMKHGPIALADSNLFTIALLSKHILYQKTKSNIEELSARDSTILTITSNKEFEMTDDLIVIPEFNHYMLEFFAMMSAIQLLSMEVAIRMGNDVDMPKNLAKSVTVE